MNDKGLQETVNSLRRIATTGAVAAAVLLVGAVVLLALSVLFQLSRFAPFGLWSVLAVLALATLAALVVWLRGPGGFTPLPGRRRRTLDTEMVFRAPPAPPVRRVREPAPLTPSGRLGAQSAVNQLIDSGRYDDALRRIDEIEVADPALATFCAAKRRVVARGRRRHV